MGVDHVKEMMMLVRQGCPASALHMQLQGAHQQVLMDETIRDSSHLSECPVLLR